MLTLPARLEELGKFENSWGRQGRCGKAMISKKVLVVYEWYLKAVGALVGWGVGGLP